MSAREERSREAARGPDRVEVLRNGEETFPALLEGIRTATRTIDLLWVTRTTPAVAAVSPPAATPSPPS